MTQLSQYSSRLTPCLALIRTGSPNEDRFNGDAIFHVLDCIEVVLSRVELDYLIDREVSSFVPLDQFRNILRPNQLAKCSVAVIPGGRP